MFDKSHGYKRLWLFNTFVIMYVVIVVTFTALEMLCLTVENVDVRDMIDDYRLTRIGVEKQHVASFWKQAPELFMCNWLDKSCRGLAEGPSAHVYQERAGITGLKWGGTRVDELPGDMDDPRLMPWWKAGLRRPGGQGCFDPPEQLLTSFHTILIVEFGGHLPTLPSF